MVGGAAITEELRPGFWFTTFSYALSLLRPRIVQDLELVKHGFMPLLMTSTFAPAEDGGYLWLTKDHDQNVREIARHSRHDADAYTQYSHDLDMVCQALKPLLDEAPPDLFSDDPEERLALARLAQRFRGMDRRTLHNAVRLLTGSAADFLDDYFESELLKGYLASSSIIGTKVGPRSQGSGLVLLYHSLGEHDGEFGAWAFHKGGNGGFTQVLARAAQSFGAEIRLEAPVAAVITKDGRAAGVALADGTEYFADTVVSALDPRRTFLELVDPRELPDDLVESIRRMRFQGTSSKVNFALDGLPQYPALPGREDVFRGFTNIGPTMDYLERAFDEAKYGWYSSRPYIDGAIQSTIDPDMAPPGKHVMSCFIQYTPYHLRESDWDAEKENLGDTVQRTLESFFPGFGDLVLQREVVTPLRHRTDDGPLGGQHLRRGVPRAADVLLPAGARLVAVPHADPRLLPVRLGHPPGGLRHGRPGHARGRAGPQGPRGDRARVGHAPARPQGTPPVRPAGSAPSCRLRGRHRPQARERSPAEAEQRHVVLTHRHAQRYAQEHIRVIRRTLGRATPHRTHARADGVPGAGALRTLARLCGPWLASADPGLASVRPDAGLLAEPVRYRHHDQDDDRDARRENRHPCRDVLHADSVAPHRGTSTCGRWAAGDAAATPPGMNPPLRCSTMGRDP